MPWQPDDVEKHKKGLDMPQKRKWCRIANETLKSCIAESGKDCESRAIRIANSSFEKEGRRKK